MNSRSVFTLPLRERIKAGGRAARPALHRSGKNMMDDIERIRKRLLEELERHFGADRRRIDHARQVLKYAEELLREERADPYVVIPAAVLHDVGIKAAEEKYGSPAARYQEQEGPAVAGRILVEMDYDEQSTYEICAIIAHHHSPGPMESENFRVLYDADLLVNLRDETDIRDKVKLQHVIDKGFLTAAGRRLAERVYGAAGNGR